jgi:hypothetical protein
MELEISLYPCYDEGPNYYRVELHSNQPQFPSAEALVHFDISQLSKHSKNMKKYGQLLAQFLFNSVQDGDFSFRKTFIDIYNDTMAKNSALHLRLFIASSAQELYDLRWETLCHPETNSFLLSNRLLLFSRYLDSLDWHSIHIPPQTALNVLVVTANSAPLNNDRVTPIDVTNEIAWCDKTGGNISFTKLLSGTDHVTLYEIINKLSYECNMLYLVCHGKMEEKIPYLYLENAEGTKDWINGYKMISQIKKLRPGPRLVVLNIRQVDGNPHRVAAELSFHLAASGIPAVVAMQDNISHKTLEEFMPCFFETLAQNAQVDSAISIARNKILKKPDWWMPTLFLRLKSGRIWYKPGFEGMTNTNDWTVLINSINGGTCVPILGPGVSEFIVGSQMEIAQDLAKKYHYPLSYYYQDNLPHVAQYLSNSISDETIRKYFISHLLDKIFDIPEHGQPRELTEKGEYLDQLISERGKAKIEQDEDNPLRILAQLPISLYITADTNSLLAHALTFADKFPIIKLFWGYDQEKKREIKYQNIELKLNRQFFTIQQDKIRELDQKIMEIIPGQDVNKNNELTTLRKKLKNQLPTNFEDLLKLDSHNYENSKPLIFHFFGHLIYPGSLVLSEDHYLKYLINITYNIDEKKNPINHSITSELLKKSLLFLGFQWDAWNFRVLLQAIKNLPGAGLLADNIHFAVQIDPEESRFIEQEQARRYFLEYFRKLNLSIYWGSVEDFLKEDFIKDLIKKTTIKGGLL